VDLYKVQANKQKITHSSLYIRKVPSAYIQAFALLYIFGKAAKNFSFAPSLIHQLWLLGSQQHPQSGVLLTSLSTWRRENSLAEKNLESTGQESVVIFLGSKICKHMHNTK
jgi:hypothetical protein